MDDVGIDMRVENHTRLSAIRSLDDVFDCTATVECGLYCYSMKTAEHVGFSPTADRPQAEI